MKNSKIFIDNLHAAISRIYGEFWKGDKKRERNEAESIHVKNYHQPPPLA
jgi:hypothetical protein